MNFIQSLLNPAAYPHPVAAIEMLETHISWVFLTGDYAYKIKKPLHFDFLDFSTLAKRHFYCEEELRLNQRFAPDLYLQVVAITGPAAQAEINGTGEVIEYAVQMRQFATAQLLSEIAQQQSLTAEIIDKLADFIAAFHAQTQIDKSSSCYGTQAEIQQWFAGNFAHIRPLLKSEKFLSQLHRLENWGEQELAKNTALIQQRKHMGFVRECHGDLHLGNIALIAQQITPFDGIEFNPALRWIDVLSEVAFVMMDLQQRGLAGFAYRFLNRYLSQSGDYQGLPLLPYYQVYRALVRTKVALLRWQQHKQAADFSEAEVYANLAEHFSSNKPPLLVITHGYSGAGKSTFSKRLAENLNLIHLRSDVERQRLFAPIKPAEQGSNFALYSAEITAQTYLTLKHYAETLLTAGFSVLIDATFLQVAQRELFQQLAIKLSVAFLILDFPVSTAELSRRILQRQQQGNDASQATLAVLQQQLRTAQALTAAEQLRLIRVDSNAEHNLTNTLEQLAAQGIDLSP